MFTPKDIEHLAKLARLKLAGAEIERYSHELDAIFDYVSKLQEVEGGSSEVPESSEWKKHWAALREDEPKTPFTDDPGARPDSLVEAMSKTRQGFLVVPKVITKD